MDEGRRVDLVGEVLDQQLVDFIGRPMGNVDGLVLELGEDEPPRVSHLQTGGVTLARRLHAPLGGWLAAAARRWGGTRGEPFRIPWERVKRVGIDVEVDLDADATPVWHWEHRLGRLVARVPGS
jgi:sporulation protein YlmC with PRC-barrel domain